MAPNSTLLEENRKIASAAQKSAIDALQKFYGLIVAIAFTGGVLKFIDGFDVWQWTKLQGSESLLFVAFVATIVPFYHGMERHLHETHIARNDIAWGKKGKPSPVLLDIFAFMFMGALLLAMGRRIDAPLVFLQLWSVLLVLDIVWSLVVWAFQKQTKPLWAVNNFFWLLIAWVLWFAIPVLIEKLSFNTTWIPVFQTAGVALSEILRSIFDYKSHWSFYFPDGFVDDDELKPNLIYLAGPYSNDAPANPKSDAGESKRLARFNAITEVAKALIENEELLYSPLTMTHPIDIRMKSKPESAFWVEYDEAFMEHCSEIRVLKLPGYDQSSGVNREIEFFKQRGIDATYLEPSEYGITADVNEFKAAFG